MVLKNKKDEGIQCFAMTKTTALNNTTNTINIHQGLSQFFMNSADVHPVSQSSLKPLRRNVYGPSF
jgi:hypothetical protein